MTPSPAMNLTNELARQRNRDAAERTLMAWIRTCLSLISFGFGLDKIVGAIDRATGTSGPRPGVIAVAVAFVLTGILAMAAATVQHRHELRRLRDDFVYVPEQRSIARATAVEPSSSSMSACTHRAVVAARNPKCDPTPAMMLRSFVRSAEPNEPSSFWIRTRNDRPRPTASSSRSIGTSTGSKRTSDDGSSTPGGESPCAATAARFTTTMAAMRLFRITASMGARGLPRRLPPRSPCGRRR